MKRIEDIERMEPDELESAAMAEDVQVPRGLEDRIKASLAAKAADSKGRVYDEPQCGFRTVYQRDRDRIVHSKAFRRLIHKTQVL